MIFNSLDARNTHVGSSCPPNLYIRVFKIILMLPFALSCIVLSQMLESKNVDDNNNAIFFLSKVVLLKRVSWDFEYCVVSSEKNVVGHKVQSESGVNFLEYFLLHQSSTFRGNLMMCFLY
jgi:hypothetical protein